MWLDGKVDDVVTVQQRVFDVERLLDSQSAVVMSIDDHILFLIGYPVQGDLLSFVVGGEQVVQPTTATFLPAYSDGTEY